MTPEPEPRSKTRLGGEPEGPPAWFDRTAGDWEDQYFNRGLRGRQVRRRMALTLDYLREEGLPSGARVLDLGCGPGIIAEKLAAGGLQVSCVDFSLELLSRARDRLTGSGRAETQLVQADAHALPFKTAAFDAVACIGVISWVADPAVALREIARVLRPGGTLVITARNRLSIENLFDPWFWFRRFVPKAVLTSARGLNRRSGAVPEKGKGPQPTQFRLRRFEGMLRNAGLKRTRWRTIKYGHFRFFGRRIFPTGIEVTIDRVLDWLWWVPVIRGLGWLYCAKATRQGGAEVASPGPSAKPPGVLVLGSSRQALTVMRSLGRAGFRIILGAQEERNATECSRHVSEIWRHPTIKSDEQAFIASLTAFVGERSDISFIAPVGEHPLACLARNFDKIPFRSALVMPDPGVVLSCLSKASLYRVVSELGIATPETRIVRNCSELHSAAESIGYPCIVKPNTSHAPFFGKKALICATAADLRASFRSWAEGNEFLIIQKYIRGERHNCHFAAQNGKSRAYFEWITVRTDRVDQTGFAVEGVSVRPVPAIESACERLLTRLNYSGVGCIQFIIGEESGVAYFLELNPRLGATCAFGYHLGLDFPKMALGCAGGRGLDALSSLERSRTYPVGKRVHWLMGDFQGWVSGVRSGELGPRAALRWLWSLVKAFMRADAHVTWSWRDPLPTLFLYTRIFASSGRRFARILRIRKQA